MAASLMAVLPFNCDVGVGEGEDEGEGEGESEGGSKNGYNGKIGDEKQG